MRQFTPSVPNKSNGMVLIAGLVGVLMIGAFGAFLFISQGSQTKAPTRPGIERTVPTGEPSVSR